MALLGLPSYRFNAVSYSNYEEDSIDGDEENAKKEFFIHL
jgi:hypothetical protein